MSEARDRTLAIGRTLREGWFISRRSAALLLGVPAPAPPGQKVEVGSFWPTRAPRRPEILGHRVMPSTLLLGSAFEVAMPSPADVWCQLASVCTLWDLVAAGDAVLSGRRILHASGRRTSPLATSDQLAAAVERHRRSTGAPLLLLALPLLRCPVDSPPESFLRMLIVEAGLPEPDVNCAVEVFDRVLHADLGYPLWKIAIEYEGAHHFESIEQARRDAQRVEEMRSAGWRVLRVTALDLRDPVGFLRRLVTAIAEAQR